MQCSIYLFIIINVLEIKRYTQNHFPIRTLQNNKYYQIILSYLAHAWHDIVPPRSCVVHGITFRLQRDRGSKVIEFSGSFLSRSVWNVMINTQKDKIGSQLCMSTILWIFSFKRYCLEKKLLYAAVPMISFIFYFTSIS